MNFYKPLLILITTAISHAQQLVINNDFKPQYIEEAAFPIASNTYVLVKDTTAYLYNTNGPLPYKTQNINDNYILNTVKNHLYNINLIPQYLDQIDQDTNELTTLVTYVYKVNYTTIDNEQIDILKKQYGHFIPKTAIPKTSTFNKTLNIEDTYATSIDSKLHGPLQSHYLVLDKNNLLSADDNGNLRLTKVKNHKVYKEKIWSNFNGLISLISSIKIGDVARIKFQRYQPEKEIVEDFWCLIDLKKQTFVNIHLKDFHTNLKNLQEQDAPLLNSVPFFYKAENTSNIKLFVFPYNNFVWLDDESYYYGSKDFSNYAIMQKENKSYSLKVHAYLFNYPSRILRAISPHEKDKIRVLEEAYVKNKHKIISERCNN
ncbi:hypothetical protein AAFN75_17295 [Algibacter sp. AS12]|uniref:hypothetical protein n=1 Tax=Algibacter sp. AS12 TaxID=3135773 RepID=UPI00398BB0FF